MILLSRRSMLAIVAVVDVALNARPTPVAAKLIAARHHLPPRHLETVLQALVRHGILKGVRGPRGGYELARERHKITAGEIVRAALSARVDEEKAAAARSSLVDRLVGPVVARAGTVMLAELDATTVDDLCASAREFTSSEAKAEVDYTI